MAKNENKRESRCIFFMLTYESWTLTLFLFFIFFCIGIENTQILFLTQFLFFPDYSSFFLHLAVNRKEFDDSIFPLLPSNTKSIIFSTILLQMLRDLPILFFFQIIKLWRNPEETTSSNDVRKSLHSNRRTSIHPPTLLNNFF